MAFPSLSVDRAARAPRAILLWLTMTAGWLGTPGDSPGADDAASARLRLRDNSLFRGTLRSALRPGLIPWESPIFHGTLQFPVGSLKSLVFDSPEPPVRAAGPWSFELAGGDVLSGRLVSLDSQAIVVAVDFQEEPIRLDRRIVERIDREGAEDGLVYVGPLDLQEWTPGQGGAEFREQGGQIVLEGPGSLTANVGLPAQLVCDLELSWRGNPDFGFQLGVSGEKGNAAGAPGDRGAPRLAPADLGPAQRPFNLEVVDGRLLALGETSTSVGFAVVETLGRPGGHTRLRIFLDQPRGRFLVTTPTGEVRADLKFQEAERRVGTGVRLICGRSAVRLESLRIRRWNGDLPKLAVADKPSFQKAGEPAEAGEIVSYDDETGCFVVRSESGERSIPADELSSAVLVASRIPAPPRTTLVTTFDGIRWSGDLLGVDERFVRLQATVIDRALALPTDRVSRIQSLDQRPLERSGPPAGVPGVLRTSHALSRGWLVGSSADEAHPLLWRPALARNAVPLRADISGRIAYRLSAGRTRRTGSTDKSQPTPENPPSPTVADEPNAGGPTASADASRHRLHLVTGEVVPCDSVQIDDRGVTLDSHTDSERQIVHQRIRALELIPGDPNDVTLPPTKREPLLTLPRIQRSSPPTHLLRSTTGDFLRGRLTGMDDQTIHLEVRLDSHAVERSLISHVFWLHPEDLDTRDSARPRVFDAARMRVQAHRNDGFRLTFEPQRLDGEILRGHSDLAGACQVDLTQLDELILGTGIEQSVTELDQHRWRLKHALEPRYVIESDGATDIDDGTSSALVGQPAPDFRLDLLDGSKFQLVTQRGHIVVLDFWASWCEPCLRTMPAVEAAVAEYEAEDVRLVAVNVQEAPDQVREVRERQALTAKVALDREGLVTQRYQAEFLPQTVIIDRSGQIVRLFTGTGNELGEQIRAALRELTAQQPAKP